MLPIMRLLWLSGIFLQAMKIIFLAMKKFPMRRRETIRQHVCPNPHAVYCQGRASSASNRALNKPTFCVYFVNILIRSLMIGRGGGRFQ